MSTTEKLEVLKQQEQIIKDSIRKLESQRERLEIEATELENFIRFNFI